MAFQMHWRPQTADDHASFVRNNVCLYALDTLSEEQFVINLGLNLAQNDRKRSLGLHK